MAPFALMALFLLIRVVHAQDPRCDEVKWVDPSDKDLLLLYRCVCAAERCGRFWDMIEIVHPRSVPLRWAISECEKSREVCYFVSENVSDKGDRRRLASEAYARCDAGVYQARYELCGASYYK